ncbi:MAG: tetratricopeptide repeat protein [Drouetiella hepatica Uher 2000/2452]|uniref:Tetratricopeptide repeat protein n=1 Tax=Drouetiella hepatica Uher 2000/2452 TaxID=904376 RepID=A0A951UNJ8_9CYAN|nr:tetratricopeptide repeat protein [Drouetiella hepatica Uher 2000/2452]
MQLKTLEDMLRLKQIWQRVIRSEPNNAAAYNNLGNALKRQGKLEEAITAFQRAIQLDPNDAPPYNGLGNALLDQGKLEEAITAFQRAIQLDPNDAYPYNGLGNALLDQGKLEEAITAFQRAIQLDPNDAPPYNGLGIALSDQGKLEEAITAYQRAIQLDPNDAPPYNNLGNALLDQGKLEEAITAFQRAIQLDPNYASPYNNLGNALSDQGKLEEAITAYQRALSLPDIKGRPTTAHTAAHNGLGFALQQKGNLAGAIEEFQQAIALDPKYAVAQNNLKEAQRLLALRQNPQPVGIDDRQFLPKEAEEPLVGVLRSTARIVTLTTEGRIIGSGWVIKRQGSVVWVVTNRHVISDQRTRRPGEHIEVEFFSELDDNRRPRYSATLEQITDPGDALDLAVLRISCQPRVPCVPDDIRPLETRSGRLARNTAVRLIGHPYTVETPWNSAEGNVMNYSPNDSLMPIDAYVAEGNSGGPVINDQRQVVGMMVQIRNKQDVATTPDQPTPALRDISEAAGDAGLAYRIDIVLEQLRRWRILN